MSKNDSQISTRSTDTQADRSFTPAPLADAATFGEFVRNHREARQISLQQIADATKIGVRQLSALERGDLRNWPGGVYRRAMIRAYAGAIGLDRNDRVLAFIRALKETDSTDVLPDAAERQVSRSAATRLSLARISRIPMALIAPCSSSVIAHLSASFTQRPRGMLLYIATASVFGLVGWYAGSRTAESRSDTQLVSPGPTFTDGAAATTGTGTAVLVRTGNPVTARGRPSADTSPAGFDRAVQSTDDVSRLARILDTEAVSSAPNAETEGVLRATSNPSGARVTVNGVGWGYTPLTIRHVPIGEKRVRISKDGYVSAERRIELTGDRPVHAVRIDLKARREAVIPQGREGLPQPKQK